MIGKVSLNLDVEGNTVLLLQPADTGAKVIVVSFSKTGLSSLYEELNSVPHPPSEVPKRAVSDNPQA